MNVLYLCIPEKMRESGWLASIPLYSLSFIPLFGTSSQVELALGCVPAPCGPVPAALSVVLQAGTHRDGPGQGREHWGGSQGSASLLRGLKEGHSLSCPLLRRKEKESSMQKYYTEI